jgi:signal transduction histidine kinase
MKWKFESADASRAYHVRHDLIKHLADYASRDSDLDAAGLIFGELVGNVVRHAPGPIAVELQWDEGIAVLRVRDHGPGFEWNGSTALPENPLSECGRGLFLVHACARRLSVRRHPERGTEATVWLPVRLAGPA